MTMQGDGPWAVAVMWAVVAVTLVFVVLRIYTRAVVVASYGIDDHVYNLAFVSSPSSLRGVMLEAVTLVAATSGSPFLPITNHILPI